MYSRVFIERMIVDSKNLNEEREKFFCGNSFTEEEIIRIGNTDPIPYHDTEWDKRWGHNSMTMVSWYGIDNLCQLLEDVIKNNIEGNFIETGVWRGGLCILARYIFKYYNLNKKVFVADSFMGLPEPDLINYPKDEGDDNYTLNSKYPYLAVPADVVRYNFRKFNLLDDQVIFLEGWFKDILPKAPVDKLCILRLDGDMYEATINSLDNLYPKLSVGGYCIIDDGLHPRCIEALNDYRSEHNITEEIIRPDDPKESVIYWKKEYDR